MQKNAMFYLQNYDLWKLSKLEKKQNFSGEHLKDDKQLALPPRRPKHGLRFLNSTSTNTVKSQCTTEQLGPQGLMMVTKYEKKGHDWSKQALTCYEALWQQRPHALLLVHLCTPARRTSRCRMVMVVIPRSRAGKGVYFERKK